MGESEDGKVTILDEEGCSKGVKETIDISDDEEPPGAPRIVWESPESPAGQGQGSPGTCQATRVVIEVQESGSRDGLWCREIGFSIDRGVQDGEDSQTVEGATECEEVDDIQVVGAFDQQPCSSRSLSRPPPSLSRPQVPEISLSTADRPVYDIEQDIIITNVMSLHRPSRDGPKPPERPVKKAISCWNCDGEHNLAQCPTPRNFNKISENRTKFLQTKQLSGGGNKDNGPQRRYHEPKPTAYKPGVDLSQELREALNLRRDQLPVHIYRMRRFGYPPGWLEMAFNEVSAPVLKLYRDQVVMNPVEQAKPVKLEDIVSFPGYNCPPPPNTYDDSRFHRCPPYSEQDSKAAFLQKVNEKAKRWTASAEVSSSPSKTPGWDGTHGWAATTEASQPSANTGAQLGIGRGRYIAPTPRPPVARFGIEAVFSHSGVHVRPPLLVVPGPSPSSSTCNPWSPAPKVEGSKSPPIDKRYLPDPDKRRMRGSSDKRKRSNSPSLLSNDRMESPELIRPDSPDPVIVLPKTAQRKSSQSVTNNDDNCSTGSSGDLEELLPKAKKARLEEVSLEDDVIMIPDDDEDDDGHISDKSDDSIRLLANDPESTNRLTLTITEREVIEIECDTKQTSQTNNITLISPFLDDDEEDEDEDGLQIIGEKEGQTKKKKPNQELSWENGDDENETEQIEDGQEVGTSPTPSPPLPVPVEAIEFIAENAALSATKRVLLAHSEMDGEQPERSFTCLPAYEKFAQGMPEMVFEEEPAERTGRLDRVLKALKTRKNTT